MDTTSHRPTRPDRRALAVIAVAGGLVGLTGLAACGDDDDMRPPATQPTAMTVAGAMTDSSMMNEGSNPSAQAFCVTAQVAEDVCGESARQ